MANFILVHGGMHGGWCWEKVVPLLREAGHNVVAPDLPAMAPNDPIAAKDVTLAMVGDFVAEQVSRLAGDTILVGHSMGGLAISEAAERVPESLSGLIYVTALLLPAGQCMISELAQNPVDIAVISDDGAVMTANMANAPGMFYNRCSAEDTHAALARLVPQPMKLGLEPLTITAERFGRVPRAYVECLDDNLVPIAVQRLMQQSWPCDPVFTMDSDHSPFLSAAPALAAHLIAAADAFDGAGERRTTVSA